MTDDEGVLNNIRRRLAYRLLPGTSEYAVALARQRALQELRHDIRGGDLSPADLQKRVQIYCYLRDDIPVRDAYDNSVESPGEVTE